MCSKYSVNITLGAIESAFEQLRIPLVLPVAGEQPSFRDDVMVAQKAPVLRSVGRGAVAELVEMCWSWRAPNGRAVANFRAEHRGFAHGRCLIPADVYYEGESSQARRRVSLQGEPWFCIAGFWRPTCAPGDAFTMLTLPQKRGRNWSGERRVVVLERRDWARWLSLDNPASECLNPVPLDQLRLTPA